MWVESAGASIQAGRVLKSLRLLRTLSALYSTSKANLPLPGDAHGLIRYLVSALMRSGLYRRSVTSWMWNTHCRTLRQTTSVMCSMLEAEDKSWNIKTCASNAEFNAQAVFPNHEIMMHTLMLESTFYLFLCLFLSHPSSISIHLFSHSAIPFIPVELLPGQL